ncbi:MAG: DNA repair protein RecN [Bacteroidetes bacterium]|nr:DNA repair protein RecN [Bacteroidota bacterium]
MIKTLEVKDYALIDQINVEFGKGLNIITGETGAGKSILIDAMGLLLGERASTEVVRKGANKSIVEGIFEVEGNHKVKNLLDENEIDDYPELILRREISLKGANRCFVNDTPVSLSFIKEIGNLLVDLHGQHEHQSLLHTETHIDYLDEFGNYDDLLTKYKNKYDELIKTEKEIETLREREAILIEKKEIYAFQINEIDNVSPEEGEEEKLNDELKILENSEKLAELSSEVYQILYEADKPVHDSIVKVKNDLSKLAEIDKSFTESSNEVETVLALINDISSFIRGYKSKIDLEPEHIEDVRERLGAINMLKKKYGGTVQSVLEHRKKIGEEFELADNFSERIMGLKNKLNSIRIEAGKLAKGISEKRKAESKKVRKNIEDSLKELGISHPNFQTVIINELAVDNNFITVNGKSFKCSAKGIDKVEFFISTNQGEDPKPLAKVASGGEISRIMLSLKSTLAKNDKLPLLIFDEIDVGVSGRIAQKVGNVLKDLAKYHQIIAITHLPQIAGLADHHYEVKKTDDKSRTSSSIEKLTDEGRVREVAKLMSGEKVTKASIKGAQELTGINFNSE